MLEDYIHFAYGADEDESLLIFLAAFLYHKDLEKSIGMFVTPNFDTSSIRRLITQVQDTLFKYSHQKFSEMCLDENFRRVFAHFDYFGSQEHKHDKEYAAGIEIINSQLQ
eukprot:CAMPEP_0168327022 /NCGR_PEP_ID=MMETSP0213-20121227/5657_1 /TAXON_ID=151035 /ORGANISM="Euplotes harpa, Strain FSP1.4" /LENGTH=109 /DNA_ID=CAMNT_0008329861 /DNA_START=771 /DNA_END=1100 /DNA_ORIENTATION=+